MDTDKPHSLHPKTHLFTVRVWLEVLSLDRCEVRVQVRHIESGETRYFRDGWSLLVYLLIKVLEVERASNAGDDSS
ncbi:MAG: hypothetical protein R3C14_23320 [Caldilineaceae bacterium]